MVKLVGAAEALLQGLMSRAVGMKLDGLAMPRTTVMSAIWEWHVETHLRHGYRLEEVQRERLTQEDEARHLKLDIETLRAPARIEALARKQSLVTPAREDAVVIERVVAAEPPAKSVVARR